MLKKSLFEDIVIPSKFKKFEEKLVNPLKEPVKLVK